MAGMTVVVLAVDERGKSKDTKGARAVRGTRVFTLGALGAEN
jgi:hypothetical protein